MALGGMTRDELMQRISSRELTEWQIFESKEPFGLMASYIGHAITASTVANVNRKKNQKAYKVGDFMPKFEKQAQTVDEMLQVAQALTIGLGGQDLREEQEPDK
jgi:hypothetical protein